MDSMTCSIEETFRKRKKEEEEERKEKCVIFKRFEIKRMFNSISKHVAEFIKYRRLKI